MCRIIIYSKAKAAARQQIQQLTTQIQQAEAENKRLSASFTTLNKDKHALMTQLAATEKEKQAALEQVKALNADKQPLATRLAAADKAPHGPANDAAAPKNEPPEMAAIVATYRLQADKDNAQLRMKEDEIELLRTQLSVQSKTRSGEKAPPPNSAHRENSRLMRSAPRWEARRSTSLPPVALRELPSTQAGVAGHRRCLSRPASSRRAGT